MKIEELRDSLRHNALGQIKLPAFDARKTFGLMSRGKGGWERTDWSETKDCEGFHGPCANKPTAAFPAMTSYPEPERNRDQTFCRECAEAYADHWTEMWREYRAGLL